MRCALLFLFICAALAPVVMAASAPQGPGSDLVFEAASEASTRAAAHESASGALADELSFPESDAGQAAFGCDSSATIDDLLASAREMFVADNYALAEILYTCLLTRDPNHLSAILELSVIYEETGKLRYAQGLLRRAALLKPYDKEIIDRSDEIAAKLTRMLRSEVDSLIARRAFQSALPRLAALLNANPDNADLYYDKARCYLGIGDADGALVEIDKAVAIQKEARFFALRSEALKLNAAKDTDELARDAKRLAATGRTEDRERALSVVSQILARDPDDKWAKKQFMLLSNGENGGTDDQSEGSRRSRLTGAIVRYAGTATRQAALLARGIIPALERHLGLLLAVLVALAALRSPLTDRIARGYEPRHALSGRLDQFHIQEVLSLIHSQERSGVLRIYSGPVKGRVYFSHGEIRHCKSGPLEGRDAVRRLLERAKEGHFVLTRLPRSSKQTIDVPFSLVLMDVGDRSFLEAGTPPAEPPTTRQKSRMKSLLEHKLR